MAVMPVLRRTSTRWDLCVTDEQMASELSRCPCFSHSNLFFMHGLDVSIEKLFNKGFQVILK